MEKKQAGLLRLFIIIIFFCLSIFFLNNNKRNFVTETHIDIFSVKCDALGNDSLHNFYYNIQPLLLSHDIEGIILRLNQLPTQNRYEFFEKIIENQQLYLSIKEKILLIYAMVAYCDKKNVQFNILDLFLKYPFLHNDTSILLVLAKSDYTDIIPLFIAWSKDRQKVIAKNDFLSQCVEKSFLEAVENNDYMAVEALFSKKVRISSIQASQLLWFIVTHNKNSSMIKLFIQHAHADINYTRHNKTLLVAAVENNNIEAVRLLLEEGAVVDRVIDKTGVTALKVAIRNKNDAIQHLLREYGA